MHSSARIRSYAAKIASTQPHIAFDLMKLAQEAEEAEKADEGQQKKQAQQGQQAQQQDDQGQDEQGQQQKKQAYVALRREVIRVASENPQARMALQPVLRLIKQIG